MKTDFLILGGGIAGLSAANELADFGKDVILLESGIYPSHKICGEFVSPEAVPVLEKWGIDLPTKINQLKLVTSKTTWCMELPDIAASISRYELDDALAKRALEKGAVIETNALVDHIEFPKISGEGFTVTLSCGKKILSKNMFISTGKLVNTLAGKSLKPRYIGVKAHFEGMQTENVQINELIMHISKGAYFGVSPIGNNKVNVAGIMKASDSEIKYPQHTFETFLKSTEALPLLKTLENSKLSFNSWMIGAVPEFGVRHNFAGPNVFLLGDAAGVIAPATGNGLAMGLTSGILAANFAIKGQDQEYKKCWDRIYRPRIRKGMLLHRLFLSPSFVNQIPLVSKLIPSLPGYCFKATRG